ncbi:MAG: hypothetical protein ACFE9I_02230 [Candidatus Hermodarchaeota archaeon]
MEPLKRRKWLTKNEKMQEMSPKDYYKKAFKEIVKEIKINESKKKSYYLIN